MNKLRVKIHDVQYCMPSVSLHEQKQCNIKMAFMSIRLIDKQDFALNSTRLPQIHTSLAPRLHISPFGLSLLVTMWSLGALLDMTLQILVMSSYLSSHIFYVNETVNSNKVYFKKQKLVHIINPMDILSRTYTSLIAIPILLSDFYVQMASCRCSQYVVTISNLTLFSIRSTHIVERHPANAL